MGIDTQLHVKSRNQDAARVELLQRKLVLLEHSGAVGNEAQQVRAELDKMEEDRAAHSDEYPIFQLIPKEMMINLLFVADGTKSDMTSCISLATARQRSQLASSTQSGVKLSV
ncbi:TPA: hypothetical protein ACH3X1_016173 [Trebouxia sp. C0004]